MGPVPLVCESYLSAFSFFVFVLSPPVSDLLILLGIAMSDFRIIFPSDNSTVEVDEFIVLLFSSL